MQCGLLSYQAMCLCCKKKKLASLFLSWLKRFFLRDNSIQEAVLKYRTYSVKVRKSIYKTLYVLAKNNNKVIFTGMVDTSKSFNGLIADFRGIHGFK